MALIKCKECGKEISNKAFFCPHCGIIFNNWRSLVWHDSDYLILVLFLLCIGLKLPILTTMLVPISVYIIVFFVRMFKYFQAVRQSDSQLRRECVDAISRMEQIRKNKNSGAEKDSVQLNDL